MAAEGNTSIGLGPVLGTIFDRRRGAKVPLRTQATAFNQYAKGYAVQGENVALNYKAGTQFWHQRADALHKGEDLYTENGVPVYAPFSGTIEGLYAASTTKDWGDIVVLRSSADPRIKTRMVHLRGTKALLKVGQLVVRGQQLGTNYTPSHFPGGDPAHVHLEAIVYAKPGEGGIYDKGTHQPASVFDIEAVFVPKQDTATSLPNVIPGAVIGVLLAALYLMWRAM